LSKLRTVQCIKERLPLHYKILSKANMANNSINSIEMVERHISRLLHSVLHQSTFRQSASEIFISHGSSRMACNPGL